MTAMAARDPFPRPLLLGAGALLLLVMAVAALGRLTGNHDIPTNGVPIAARDLRFADRADGGIDVTDARTGAHLAPIQGQAGFVRGTLRGLASARLRAGLTADQPFRLTAWRDGRLTLDDPALGRHVELEAFGATNEDAFAAMLREPEPPK